MTRTLAESSTATGTRSAAEAEKGTTPILVITASDATAASRAQLAQYLSRVTLSQAGPSQRAIRRKQRPQHFPEKAPHRAHVGCFATGVAATPATAATVAGTGAQRASTSALTPEPGKGRQGPLAKVKSQLQSAAAVQSQKSSFS